MTSSFTRREFLGTAAAGLGMAMLPWPAWAQAQRHWVFIGAYTNTSGENVPTDFGTRGPDAVSRGISSFSFDAATGKAGPVQLAAEVSSPVNLTMHANKKFLYAGRGQSARVDGQSPVTAFAIEADGTLRELNTIPCGGDGPSVGVVDSTGRNLLIPNWSSSSVVCLRLYSDGSLGERTALVGRELESRQSQGAPGGMPPGQPGPGSEGRGPDGRGSGSPGSGGTAPGAPGSKVSPEMIAAGHTKPHGIALSKTERFAVVAEINANRCHVLRFDAKTGSLETHMYAEADEGCGPRHVMFHPTYRWLYTSGEEGSTISSWQWNEEKGEAVHLQSLSTLPEGYDGKANHPADVRVHPGGNFVYVSNRSTGTIAGFAIDPAGGGLAPVSQTEIGSPACWGLDFDPSGKWAIVTAQIGDAVRIYAVEKDGSLTFTGQEVKVVLPSCVRMT